MKIKRLRQESKKIKDGHKETGNNCKKWKFYDKINDIIGDRPFVPPPVIFDTLQDSACASSSTEEITTDEELMHNEDNNKDLTDDDNEREEDDKEEADSETAKSISNVQSEKIVKRKGERGNVPKVK